MRDLNHINDSDFNNRYIFYVPNLKKHWPPQYFQVLRWLNLVFSFIIGKIIPCTHLSISPYVVQSIESTPHEVFVLRCVTLISPPILFDWIFCSFLSPSTLYSNNLAYRLQIGLERRGLVSTKIDFPRNIFSWHK